MQKKINKKIHDKNKFTNPVGRFMVAAGAILELKNTGKILIQKRSESQDWQANEWEIPYGRLAQFIVKPIRIWHLYRGDEKRAENELVGITFHCRTKEKKIVCSEEHSTYLWATPEEALKLIKVEGIRMDVEAFIKK